MKRYIILFCYLGTILISCNGKNLESKDLNNVSAKDTLADYYEHLEGKVIMTDHGEWYVVKEGKRWRAMSEPATTDYLNSIKNGQNNVVKNVPSKILQDFPIAGEILPKLEFKSDKK
jgi:hypothetical protein